MTARYPSFISPDWTSDAAPLSFSDSRTVSHTPIEEPARCPSSVVHQQAPLQPYDSTNYNPTTHGNPVPWTGSPANLGNRTYGHHSALGFSTDGSTNPDPLTNLNDCWIPTWNDYPIIPPAGSQGALSLPPPALDSAHDQINEIYQYNHYIPGLTHSGPSNLPSQSNIVALPPSFGAPWLGPHSIPPVLQPDTYQISPRTDALPSTPCGPYYTSLSTPDGSTGVPVLSSGPSPSFSQHHRTPSSVSSFILDTPDKNPRHLENCYQIPLNPVDHTSSHQRPVEALAPCQVMQNALGQSAMETKQPKVVPNNTLEVPLYRKIAPAPSGYVKHQKESSSRGGETKQARQRHKETSGTRLGRSHKFQVLLHDTVVFKESLTPTNVGEDSFSTSSRRHDERIIKRIGVNAEAGYSIAPNVQAKLCGGPAAPTCTPIHSAKRTPAAGLGHSWQRRNSKEAQGSGGTSAPRRTSGRSPPAKPQNSMSQNAGTPPTLGKRQKRHTTDSNSSSNSSKTPTGRSRTNSHEDQKPTHPSSQQIVDYSNGRTRSFRKNSGWIGCEGTSAAISVQPIEPTSSQRNSPSRNPVPLLKRQCLVPLDGRSRPVGRTVAKPRTGPTQGKSVSYRNGPTHGAGYQASWEAEVGCAQEPGMNIDRTQQQLPARMVAWTHLHAPAMGCENLLSAPTLLGAGNFPAESDTNDY